MELLRIISILFVTIHHFLVHGAYPTIFDKGEPISVDASIALFLNGFLFIGVNCFLFISGYYGIKCRAKGIVKLLMICAFYSIISYFLHLGLDHQSIGKSMIRNLLFLSTDQWWFVKCYVGLWLLSPILNKAIHAFTKLEYQIALLFMAIYSIFLGNIRQIEFFDHTGFSIIHFVFIYMLGGYLRHHCDISYFLTKKRLLLTVFILSGIIWGVLSIMDHHCSMRYWHICTYNNVVLMITSLSFFIFFMTMKIPQSRLINSIAVSVFSVYLLQEAMYVKPHLYGYVGQLCNYADRVCTMGGTFMAIGCAILFFIACCGLDRIRIALFDLGIKIYSRFKHE